MSYEYDENYMQTDRDARFWAMMCHLSSFAGLFNLIPLGGIVVPLIIWMVKRDEDPFIDYHGREVLNFQISIAIYTVIAIILCFVVIGFLILPLLFLMDLILTIVAAIRARDGETYRYPMTIRFL